MKRRVFLSQIATFVLLPFVLGGCSKQQGPLRVGIHPWIGYEPLLLADEFDWLGNKIRLHKGSNAGDSLAALQAGKIDAAALTLDEVLVARSFGIPLTVVAILDVSAGADILVATPEIQSLADLYGKRIAAENSALGTLVLSKVLDIAGLKQTDVTVLDIPPDAQAAAWNAGEIDAAVTYEPTASILMSKGGQRLFDSREIPDTIFDVLAVHQDQIRQNASVIRKLVSAHFRGLKYMRVNRGDALYRIAAHQQVDVEVVRRSLAGVFLPSINGNRNYLADKSRFDNAAMQLHQLMSEKRLIKKQDDLKSLFTEEFLPDA